MSFQSANYHASISSQEQIGLSQNQSGQASSSSHGSQPANAVQQPEECYFFENNVQSQLQQIDQSSIQSQQPMSFGLGNRAKREKKLEHIKLEDNFQILQNDEGAGELQEQQEQWEQLQLVNQMNFQEQKQRRKCRKTVSYKESPKRKESKKKSKKQKMQSNSKNIKKKNK